MSFICYLQNIALGAALMARLFLVRLAKKRISGLFWPVFVRFPYYLL